VSHRGRPPAALVAPAIVGFGFLLLPLFGLLERVPWRGLPGLLGDRVVRDALGLSLMTASCSAALAVIFGVPLAWLLVRTEFPGRRIVRSLVTLPLVLPPVVGGVALLFAFGRRGLFGPLLEDLHISLAFSTTGVVLAETFVSMPFLVVAVEGALSGQDERFEEAAATLGAGPWATFRRVTLPLIAPSIGAGAALAFARALGEFGATITFAGNLPGRTQTLPLATYIALETNPEAAVALSLVLLVASIIVLALLRERWLRPRPGQ